MNSALEPRMSTLGLDRPKSLFADQGEHAQRPGIVLYITKLINGGWLFQWPSTGDPYYRIVLQGEQIATVVDSTNSMQSYTITNPNFTSFPPPLEIMPASAGLAPSEINQPFLSVQWYGNPTAAMYQIQENIGGSWQLWFQIAEIGVTVYTWNGPILEDQTIHNYQVVAFNSLGQTAPPVPYQICVVTPPLFDDNDYEVNYASGQLVLSLS
jgi:hypothetical protein